MKIIQETTRFIDDIQIDINYLGIQKYKNPLVIATREGQIYRIYDWQDRNNYKAFKVIGWWDIMYYGYLTETGLVRDKWVTHDIVVFLDKARASDIKVYETLINRVNNLL